MNKKTLEVAVESTLPLVSQFDEVMGLQMDDITKSAEMLVSVERAEGDIADKKAGLSSLLYGVLVSQGEPMTNGWFEMVRLQWRGVYNTAKGGMLNDGALDTAWSRVFKMVSDDYGLTKPKAETKDAEKKAVQRQKQAELLAAYEDVPIDDIKAQVKDLFTKAGDGDEKAKAEANKLSKVVKALTKAETDEAKARMKEVKAEITKLVKECDNLDVLETILSCAFTNVMAYN